MGDFDTNSQCLLISSSKENNNGHLGREITPKDPDLDDPSFVSLQHLKTRLQNRMSVNEFWTQMSTEKVSNLKFNGYNLVGINKDVIERILSQKESNFEDICTISEDDNDAEIDSYL